MVASSASTSQLSQLSSSQIPKEGKQAWAQWVATSLLGPLLQTPGAVPVLFRRVCLCGAGNGAHVFAALMASKGIEVTIYSPRKYHIEKWYAPAPEDRLRVTAVFPNDVKVTGTVQLVTDDPAAAAHMADLVIICLPTEVHDEMIAAVAPHLRPGTPVGTIQGGWWGKPRLPGMEDKAAFIMCTLPWACRITTYGQEVQVFGAKDFVNVATSGCSTEGFCLALQAAIEVPVRPAANMLSVSAFRMANILHPAIMYGRLSQWDGSPFDQELLFYEGVDDESEEVLLRLTDEGLAITQRVGELHPHLDLSAVVSTYGWLTEAYADQIGDASSLKRVLQTNAAYKGLKFPMQPGPDGKGFMPMFTYRYLTSDAAIHLMVLKGIAELADVPTPMLDCVLEWAQEKLGQEWVRDGRVCGRDLAQTRAPQKYGINTLDELIRSME